VDIDAVEQRRADLAEILLDLPGRAAALARAVAVEAAFAPVQFSTVLLNGYIDRPKNGPRSEASEIIGHNQNPFFPASLNRGDCSFQ
jgi:hypothetical protein